MKIEKTPIPDLLEITPQIFGDERGYFYESYNKKLFSAQGLDMDFVQDNQSLSNKGVLRGMHFQNPPFAQGKLVRVIQGAVLDVVIDIRKGSPTFGKHHRVILNGENKKMFWIPPGFAHGFLTLEDQTIFAYKCTNFYNKASEGSLQWNDADLNIDWGINQANLSEKDTQGFSWKDFETQFNY